jgi:hypothetical protein
MAKRNRGSGRNRHVVKDGSGWAVKRPGVSEPESRHRTQRAAEHQAKRQVGREGGGEVRIHGRDGRIRDSDTVPPGRDPFPPRDRKH